MVAGSPPPQPGDRPCPALPDRVGRQRAESCCCCSRSSPRVRLTDASHVPRGRVLDRAPAAVDAAVPRVRPAGRRPARTRPGPVLRRPRGRGAAASRTSPGWRGRCWSGCTPSSTARPRSAGSTAATSSFVDRCTDAKVARCRPALDPGALHVAGQDDPQPDGAGTSCARCYPDERLDQFTPRSISSRSALEAELQRGPPARGSRSRTESSMPGSPRSRSRCPASAASGTACARHCPRGG